MLTALAYIVLTIQWGATPSDDLLCHRDRDCFLCPYITGLLYMKKQCL